jgi:hypothetical protein
LLWKKEVKYLMIAVAVLGTALTEEKDPDNEEKPKKKRW